ncbi:hypothetical protein [Gluconacetobacter azotocaptans]|nr:hypothetical protein [Gluconacetobacter azotocaptans]
MKHRSVKDERRASWEHQHGRLMYGAAGKTESALRAPIRHY